MKWVKVHTHHRTYCFQPLHLSRCPEVVLPDQQQPSQQHASRENRPPVGHKSSNNNSEASHEELHMLFVSSIKEQGMRTGIFLPRGIQYIRKEADRPENRHPSRICSRHGLKMVMVQTHLESLQKHGLVTRVTPIFLTYRIGIKEEHWHTQ